MMFNINPEMPNDQQSLLPLLSPRKISLRAEIVLLLIIVAIASFFRLYQLGVPAFRADTMIFMDFASRPAGPLEIISKWMEMQGITGQFPPAVAWMKFFLEITSLSVTPFAVRLPSAIWGILTVLAVYGCGRVLAGNAFALFLGALFAINPFHIGISREAYFYPPLVLGSVMLMWAMMLQVCACRNKASPSGLFYFLLSAGFFLATYFQPSSWNYALTVSLIMICFQAIFCWHSRRISKPLILIIAIFVIIGFPLLFADWALPQIIKASAASHKEYVRRVFGPNPESVLITLARTLFSFGWGATVPRVIFTLVAICLSIYAIVRQCRASKAMSLLVILMGSNVLLFAAAKYFLMEYATSSRYLLALLPVYVTLLALGLWYSQDFFIKFCKHKSSIHAGYGLFAVLLFAAVFLNVWPAWLGTRLSGKPTPYWDIARWCDKNLPRHSLVLVERWFDPWNELRIHNSTNVYFTFPVPSEPPDVFKQVNWPLHARLFMEKYPDAAYVEYFASERQTKGLVTNWHFARSVSFTNAAALKLSKLGLAHREEFNDTHSNKLVVTIFYNTREDVLANARAAGKDCLVLYGPEWGYIKLWQQLRDFRDWRVLEREASLEVFNLTRTTNTVAISVTGMALNGVKRVALRGIADGRDADLNDGSPRPAYDFRHLQLAEWNLGNLTLKPGLNRIVLSDPMWNISKVPALIDRVEVHPKP